VSIVSARSTRPSRWTAARVSVVWRNFDLQLATYAALLLGFGLAMAYSNAATSGSGVLDGGSVFLRALMWTAIAIAVFLIATTFDYHWLKTFAWPLYLVQLGLLVVTLAIGRGRGRHLTLGLDLRPAVPVQRARQGPDDRGARELSREPRGQARLALGDRRRGRPSRSARSCWS
jgi:hypothetical protein